jgi:tRNA G18 (ribose-2'-O)-methylase SpoU
MQAFLDGIIIQLLDMSLASSYCGGISAGSAVFGRKLRSWQTLCLLSCHVHEELVPAVNARLWNVVRQANLNAIAHYVELFAARLVARYPLLLVEQHVLRELSDVSIAGHIAASFGLILGVALPRLMAQGLGDLREAAVTAMLPWLSCDTGHARTIAQCVVSQLLPGILRERETAGDAAEVDVSDTAFLRATLAMLQQNKDIVRMLGMQQRYFARTDPERECSLEALLSAPLGDFTNEIEPIALMACIKDTLKSVHKMLTNEYIEQVGGPCAPAADTARAVEAPALSSAGDIQRKVDPWAALQAALQQQSCDAPEVCGRANLVSCGRTRQPLLVCASLVDKVSALQLIEELHAATDAPSPFFSPAPIAKVPNLAGLARTCEIFGAEGLTIPSMKLMAHPLFTQISVTAEKWVPVTEVKEAGLRPYLTTCKKAGYTVVGVEQTANSCNLLDYTFPEKVVLVLGKEREGIPVDVLQDVDVCVEIPQLGLIRSLNVHVTGALMIWAYTQQKLLAKQDRDTSDLAPPPPPPTGTPL